MRTYVPPHMRDEQGMSNREIAEALGVSYTTILKLIGKQPASVRKERQFVEPSKAVKPIDDDRPAALIVAERTYPLQGQAVRYSPPCRSNTFHI